MEKECLHAGLSGKTKQDKAEKRGLVRGQKLCFNVLMLEPVGGLKKTGSRQQSRNTTSGAMFNMDQEEC